MKKLILLIIFFRLAVAFGQNCNCETDSMLKEKISCDTIKFENEAQLYWNFNCDSSWLTFKNSKNIKKVIFSLEEGLIHLTGNLGHIFAQEYEHTFLIQHNVISGCCTPPDYYLYDKSTGELKSNFGPLIYYSEDKKYPLTIAITDSDNNSLTIYNVNSGKIFKVLLPKGKIKKAMKSFRRMYPEDLFDSPILSEDTLSIKYYLNPLSDNKNSSQIIALKLSDYIQ
jgi:hypothetical protein